MTVSKGILVLVQVILSTVTIDTQENTVSDCFLLFTANSTGLVRLVNGDHPAQGNVEIRYNLTSPWGTICSSGWDIKDARVACRQLGYADAVAATIESSFGRGRGSIWLSNFRCNGFENKISECGSSNWGNPSSYCLQYATTSTSYHGVAGAVCQGKSYIALNSSNYETLHVEKLTQTRQREISVFNMKAENDPLNGPIVFLIVLIV